MLLKCELDHISPLLKTVKWPRDLHDLAFLSLLVHFSAAFMSLSCFCRLAHTLALAWVTPLSL